MNDKPQPPPLTFRARTSCTLTGLRITLAIGRAIDYPIDPPAQVEEGRWYSLVLAENCAICEPWTPPAEG